MKRRLYNDYARILDENARLKARNKELEDTILRFGERVDLIVMERLGITKKSLDGMIKALDLFIEQETCKPNSPLLKQKRYPRQQQGSAPDESASPLPEEK
jgi:hypothetical protein